MTAEMRPTTMSDVARLAQVSAMTVSRVVTGRGQVNGATRERVETAMRQLRYSPNVAARTLASGRSGTIGVLTFDTSQYGPGAALLGIERAARQRGYGVSIATVPTLDRVSMTEALDSFVQRSTDGVIAIVPHLSAAQALSETRPRLPVVAVQGTGSPRIPAAAVDQRTGGFLATTHLLDLGHETVWHIGGPEDWFETRERERGWREALASRSAPVPPVVSGDWSPGSGYAAGRVLLAATRPPTAVFVANDQMALGLLHLLYEHGLSAPKDLSVVGFDDIPEAAYLSPALTTVRQDFNEMGRLGMALLLDILTADRHPTAPVALIEPDLVVRASTGRPPSLAKARRGG
ncbi:LacI family DNA-binding transcriptional regulator [Lapillicoccus sp.]|uniref:LacI family DNA-binding transcriptional regulator n=1 Tax=Lapillicoccus sp. TaxID=1909287 RepID=UPI0025E88FB5|nr:LacI family DNA-binding transcriptional regulator [Lapillicoccus sp.]